MTVRNLASILKPASVALIGASQQSMSVGNVIARNLLGAGFDGPVLPVNPHDKAVAGVLAYPDIASLPITPDLAVIATPPHTVPGIIAELGQRGTRGAIVITAGFGGGNPGQDDGRTLRQQMLDAARPHLLRILGPNCLGAMVPGHGLNASFIHIPPLKGDLAVLAQSGAVLTAMVDWATTRGIGFSYLVSMGDMADVDFGDMLDYMAADVDVRAILLYVEAITNARKFMSAARAAARAKPVIVIKAGRCAAAAKAASSHTGALAGSDSVYDAAFQRAGMLRVHDLDELFDAVETLSTGVRLRGDRLAILTNGGGMGVLATDTLIADGGRLAELSEETINALSTRLPPTWSRGNPVDIIGDADGSRYAAALSLILEDPGVDITLVLNSPVAVADSTEVAQTIITTLDATNPDMRKPLLTCWVGEGAAREARQLFYQQKIPTYPTPDKAVRALGHLRRFQRNREILLEIPPTLTKAPPGDHGLARTIISSALAEGRGWLMEDEAKRILSAWGVPTVRTLFAANPADAALAAEQIGGKVALKILSPDITHKSDVGGVQLQLAGGAEVEAAALAMRDRVLSMKPQANIRGFSVQEMANKPDAHELILGMVEDSLFGPVILFGQGGIAVEVIEDKALVLAPLNMALAHEMIAQTRVSRLLNGYRSRPAANINAIADALICISQMICDLPEITELDINPLFADEHGVLALDARIRVATPRLPGTSRLAIRPYPEKLEKTVTLPNGEPIFIRPIRPEDEPLLHEMITRMAPEDIRLRFFVPLRQLSRQTAARMTQIDYDREMALVALPPTGKPEMLGIVRLASNPDNLGAEYAVLVRSDMKGRGLGLRLMEEILSYAKSRNIPTVYGQVLRENKAMLQLCEGLGFTRHQRPDDPGVIEVRVDLSSFDPRRP